MRPSLICTTDLLNVANVIKCTSALIVKTIALVSQKGGVGKSTLAVNLAASIGLEKERAVLIDLDIQGSCGEWSRLRKKPEPLIFQPNMYQLPDVLKQVAAKDVAFAIVDTAPSARGSVEIASKAADFLLIPCRPALFDFAAIAKTVELATRYEKPYGIVLTGAPPRGHLAEEARVAIRKAYPAADVAPTGLDFRVAYMHALVSGLSVREFEPRGKAAAEVAALCRWLRRRLKG